jgi:hypothetical protein
MTGRAALRRTTQAAELAVAERQLAAYARDLSRLPVDAVVKRVIQGRPHYYQGRLASARHGGCANPSAKRAQYRKLMAGLEARILRLRSAMRDEDRRPA